MPRRGGDIDGERKDTRRITKLFNLSREQKTNSDENIFRPDIGCTIESDTHECKFEKNVHPPVRIGQNSIQAMYKDTRFARTVTQGVPFLSLSALDFLPLSRAIASKGTQARYGETMLSFPVSRDNRSCRKIRRPFEQFDRTARRALHL